MLSICVGAFGLAHAGILDGRSATTHWAAAPALRSGFPRVTVVPDVLYVDDGDVLTSAGLAAGLDLCLHLFRRDYGAAAAIELARWNVVAPHRAGGQAQFVKAPVPPQDEEGLGPTRAWALARVAEPLTVPDLVQHARCGERTFNRRFQQETGTSPHRWLLAMRLERARLLLETTRLPIDGVARAAGFPTPAALRDRFATALGTTPTAYRRAFQGSARQTEAPPKDNGDEQRLRWSARGNSSHRTRSRETK